MSLKENFFNSITFTVINKYGKKCCHSDFKCFYPFTMMPVEGCSETEFLDIYLTTIFGVSNIGNTSAMTLIFFQKYSRFNLNFKNAEKKI